MINQLWFGLAALCSLLRLGLFLLSRRSSSKTNDDNNEASKAGSEATAAAAKKLTWLYLPCFLCFKIADWMQGPYLYDAYTTKVWTNESGHEVQLVPQSEVMILMLTGFITNAVFSSVSGVMTDKYGRKKAVLALTLFTVGSALSVRSNNRLVLYLGRVCGGASSSLLYTAPEAWLNAEAGSRKVKSRLGAIFGWAYFLDGIVAVAAGQVANAADSALGPTGPFFLSAGFSALAGVLVLGLWTENFGGNGGSSASSPSQSVSRKVRVALRLMASDSKIQKIVVSQTAFEGAMYMFVCVWVPALQQSFSSGLQGSTEADRLPFGTIFSCFMICCMIGSSLFSVADATHCTKRTAFIGVLSTACAALGISSCFEGGVGLTTGFVPYALVLLCFCIFEASVGCYYPLIGTLRGAALDNVNASTVMTLARIPLNLVVIIVLLGSDWLGHQGVLLCAAILLAGGTAHFHLH